MRKDKRGQLRKRVEMTKGQKEVRRNYNETKARNNKRNRIRKEWSGGKKKDRVKGN